MIRHASLRIKSIYLDSFIYSGTLFLLDMDGVLTSYDWQRVVSLTLSTHGRQELAPLFLDSRQPNTLEEQDGSLLLDVPDNILQSSATSFIRLNVWPTDLSIYANKIYISDESGAHMASFDYASKSIAQDGTKLIKSGYIYSIAPGDGGRLAIASASSGLSLLILNEKEKQLIEDNIYDCDWFGTSLVANSAEHSYLAKFTPLPKREKFEDALDFLTSMKHAKNADPTTAILGAAGKNEYHWLAGEDILQDVMQIAPDDQNDFRVIKARSASFGSIIERIDGIIIQRSDSRQILDIQKPFFWRTFSRSKNYLNHLHACNGDGMEIRAYDTKHLKSDRFAVDLSDFEN